eukprot:11168858-Lingulodinium_polyedra.AAC.1
MCTSASMRVHACMFMWTRVRVYARLYMSTYVFARIWPSSSEPTVSRLGPRPGRRRGLGRRHVARGANR